MTNLTFEFVTVIPVESGCFVKLEVPKEFDMSNFDASIDMTSTGMLVD